MLKTRQSSLTFDTFCFFNSSTFNPSSRSSLVEADQPSTFNSRASALHPFRRRYRFKFRQKIPVIPVQKPLSVPATRRWSSSFSHHNKTISPTLMLLTMLLLLLMMMVVVVVMPLFVHIFSKIPLEFTENMEFTAQ
jgi:hypothetical protein